MKKLFDVPEIVITTKYVTIIPNAKKPSLLSNLVMCSFYMNLVHQKAFSFL